MVENHRGALRLAAVDALALRAGLRTGMMLAEARAIVPALTTADHAPESDRTLLFRCAEAALRFTPLVALDGEDGLTLDITGCAHLLGGEENLLHAARRLMLKLGLTPRAAIATTPEAARAFARFSVGGIVDSRLGEASARRLPVETLEADTEITRALTRAGLRTLNDLAIRHVGALTARFGEDLMARLRRILGHEDRRITPLRAPPEIMAERHFPEPLGLIDDLLRALESLVLNAAVCLEARGEGGRRLAATFFRSDGAVRSIDIRTARPTRQTKILMALFRLRIDALTNPLDPGFGFDAIRLSVLSSEPLVAQQDDLVASTTSHDQQQAIAGLVDRLVARFGPDNIRQLAAVETHDPARAAVSLRFDAQSRSPAYSDHEPEESPTRPLTLFAKPQSVDVVAEVPDGPPIRFRWRRVMHDITRAEGPERIAPEWWRLDDTFPAIRDYYRVEDADGYRFWLFREGFYTPEAPPRWFIHGLFA